MKAEANFYTVNMFWKGLLSCCFDDISMQFEEREALLASFDHILFRFLLYRIIAIQE